MKRTRRRFVQSVGAGALVGVAGCSTLSDGSSDLDVWIRNDLGSPIDYEISVDDFEESGSLEAEDGDDYDNVIGAGSGESVDVSVRFGLRTDGEFTPLAAGSDSLTVQDATKAVFARYTDMGAYYGLSDES